MVKWNEAARTTSFAKRCVNYINAKLPVTLFMVGMLVAVIFNFIFFGMIVWFEVVELFDSDIFAGILTILIGAGLFGGLSYGIYSVVKPN